MIHDIWNYGDGKISRSRVTHFNWIIFHKTIHTITLESIHWFGFFVVPAPLVVLSLLKRFSFCNHKLRDYVPEAYKEHTIDFLLFTNILLIFNIRSSWYCLGWNWGKFIHYPHQKKINTMHNRSTLDLSFWVIDYWNLWLRHWKVRCQKKKCNELWDGPTHDKL